MGHGVTTLSPVPTTGVGLPDYTTAAGGGNIPQGKVYTSQDSGENAVRLGSPVSFDRRGNVLFQTDFQAAINQFTFNLGAGAGALAEQSAEVSKNGGASLKMCGGVGTATSFTWLGSMIGKSKLGVEVSICSLDLNFTQIAGNILVYDGTNLLTTAWGIVRNAVGSDDVFVLDLAGNPVLVVNNILLPWTYSAFTTIKVVIDLNTGKYERFLINNLAYDISKVQANVAAVAFAPSIWIQVGETSAAAITSTFYHNAFIVTQNEPVNG